MRAVVYAGPGEARLDDVAEPQIQEPGDAIVAVRKTAICGSDLHLLGGKSGDVRTGAVIGHEFVGTIRNLGDRVSKHWEDQRVLGSFLLACGRCAACDARRFNFCERGRALGMGVPSGDLDGAQAEFVRVPDADVNLRPLSGALTGLSDEEALFAGDILAAAFHAAARAEIEPGETVAVLGAGPVGLLCAAAARRRSPGTVLVVDRDPARAMFATERLGFDAAADDDAAAAIARATGSKMADVVIDAVGAVDAFKSALRSVRLGGRVVVVGVYGAERYELAMGRAWLSGIDIRFIGMANVHAHWEEALMSVAKGELEPTKLITHRLALDDALEGYRVFEAKEAMKVVLTP